MIIENPDAFKTWLTSILEPLCDADPAALAKYVYALVKKDKPLDELRDGMLDQLDVFLQLETKPFVDMLFKSLETLDYLTAYESQPAAEPAAPEPAREPEADLHAPGVETSLSEPASASAPAPAPAPASGPAPSEEAAPRYRVVVPRAPAKTAPPPPAPAPTPARAPPLEQTLVKHIPLTELLEEIVEQPVRRRDRRDLVREREERRRRRSRSWERRARPRRHDHAPPDARRHDKRRPSSRSPSPRGRYRNRSPPAAPAALDRPPTRSRSRSPLGASAPRERERARAPRDLERERERERMSRDRDHGDRATRSRDRERSRSRSPALSRSASPEPRPDAGKRRCRDFDEKGYCMRGDLCQWDHGKDPVVLEDPSLSRVLALPVPEYNPATPDIWAPPLGAFPGALPYPHPVHAHPHPHPHGHLPPGAHPPHLPPGAHPPHPVHPAHMAPPPPLPPQHPLALAPHPPRELISVPRARDMPPVPASTPAAAPGMPPPRHPGPHKKGFDYNRLGAGRAGGGGMAAGNCSLEVKKIPRGLNDITHLNNHFNKFGKIVNIKVYYDGDPEAALITFSNHTEANIAYKSTEAVLNNRFIKVFWHNNAENKQENSSPGGGGGQAASKTSQAGGKHASQNKVLINHDNIKATADTKQQMQQQQQQQQLADKEKAKSEGSNGQAADSGARAPAAAGAAGPVAGAGAAGVGKQAQELSGMCQRAQALLNSELERQAVRIDLLESGNLTESQKEELSQVIKLAQKGVEKLNNQLRSYQKKMMQMQEENVARLSSLRLAQAAKKPKTKEEAEKEILDAELDMFTKQQEGQDVTEQIKKIAALRRQMALQFPAHPASRRPHAKSARYNPATRYSRAGAGGGAGAGAGGAGAPKFVNQSVDHRPRALRISGFEPDDLDALVAHFSQFGEVTGKEVDPAVPELVLQYRARAHAELALMRGKHYNDRTLSITWAVNGKPMSGAAPPPAAPTPAAAAPAPAAASTPHHNGDAPAPAADAEAPQESPQPGSALHFDEEDDEDAEDRSWRR